MKGSAMPEITLLEKITAINEGLRAAFGEDDSPFEIATRLLEEAGELAAEINNFEDSGVKHVKHGEPDRMALAKEVQDVIRYALQVADYYDLDAELNASVEKSY
jgi:NTP pyrophosphatase (non-canonical NTP hydrolase)